MKFSAEYRVDTHDTDMNGCATATSVMRYMQETATLQHEKFGPTPDELRASGKAFILSRASLDILFPLFPQDSVAVDTWLTSARGFGFIRCFEIRRGGELAARMSSYWGVVNILEMKPLKADTDGYGFGTCSDEVTTVSPTRVHIPAGIRLDTVMKRTVRYSDCDKNIHLNNTKYPAVFCDCLDMTGKFVSGLSVNYCREARLGTEFSIMHGFDDGKHFFRTLLHDGSVGAEAIMTLGTL